VSLEARLKRLFWRFASPVLDDVARRVARHIVADPVGLELELSAAARNLAREADFRSIPPQAMAGRHSPTVGFFGNIANNAYNFVKCLRRLGQEAELVVEQEFFDQFLMNRPFWEDIQVSCASVEAAYAHESGWRQPHYVRRVQYDAEMQQRFAGRLSAVPEVQELAARELGRRLPADHALLLAQNMGHWPMLLAMRRYDVVQLSGATIRMGLFCPRPYVLFPTGSDLFISPFEETVDGLLARIGFRRAARTLYCEVNYPAYLRRLGADEAAMEFAPMMIDDDTYTPVDAGEVRESWREAVGGSFFILSACRQSWEWKGNDRLLEAFARLERPEARLIVIRWGPDAERSAARIEELGATGRVLWLELSSKRALARCQSAADLVADQFVMDGYGTTVLESMASATPVAMRADEDLYRTHFDEPPPFIPCAEVDEIAMQLRRFIDDPEARAERARESRTWLSGHHGYRVVAPTYLRAYELAARLR
jgi:glycosyltransferase involved in cell wall biosynthesis